MVIQRWQSVMLLLTVALMACFTFMSLGQVQTATDTLNYTTLGFYIEGESTGGAPSGYVEHTWFLFIISLMTIIIPFINIFMYRNLPLQKRLCLVEILFVLSAMSIAGWTGYFGIKGAACSWSSLAIAPFLALILMVMAWTFINKDHKLLKSVDRIR